MGVDGAEASAHAHVPHADGLIVRSGEHGVMCVRNVNGD